ncbi:MAG: phosphate acyltransferase PlsX [Gemmatimonadota bacterium]|nr:phosphate acyltransferase PlsX [Gemmatimonadota bacterium]MDH3422092.1 phosphate acyltransferase PlsX [Gemmatimonadota bacterium]
MRIALDAMGTDQAPGPEVAGAIEALREFEADVEVVLVGDEPTIRAELAKHADVPERLLVHHAPDRVTADDAPASVIRRKPDSSVVVGLKLQKNGEADAFVSAGSTGAVMATSLFTLRPLPGVDRPAVGTLLPSVGEPFLLLDSGANVDCKPHHLIQFAHLGSTYMQNTLGRANPRVALLNIGEEPGKGNELVAETYGLLAGEPGINFVGNIEGRDIIGGEYDVVVCDGFVGNVLLKFYESVAGLIVRRLHKELDRSQASEGLEFVFRVLDYAETGGAPLLGVGGVSIICHGESTPAAIKSALAVAAQAVRSDMVKQSAKDVQGIELS